MIRNDTKDISHVVAEYLCHSCGACFVACKHSAISYHETTGGYLFPKIDLERCTHCGLCYDVCSGHHFGKTLKDNIHRDPFVGDILSCEVGRASDDNVFRNGQSGGVATALLAYLFESNQIEVAIVVSMRRTIPPRGEVCIMTSLPGLRLVQKSKYVPIPLLTAIKRIDNVKGGVAIVGLPCHFHGLQNLLDLHPDLAKKNFFKIGLICDRVMTNSAIDFMVKKATCQPVNHFIFRDKTRPSYPGNPVIEKVEGGSVALKASLRMMIKDFFTPTRCRLCFDKLNVFADVVLGDPHGVSGVDRVHGETLTFSRTIKGKSLIDGAKQHLSVKLRDVDIGEAIDGQKIDKKRIEWTAFMSEWKRMSKLCPDYAFAAPRTNRNSKSRKLMLHSLALDSFASSDDLIRSADRWLTKQKVKNILRLIVRKFISIIRKVN